MFVKAEEETWSLPFLISLKRVRNTLTGFWVCNVFPPKKTVMKILLFLFPVWKFVCTQLLAAAFPWSEFLFQQRCSSSWVYTFHVGIFLQSPLSALADLMTSLFCSYFSLPFMLVDSCRVSLTWVSLTPKVSAFICFFHFLPLYSWAKDTVVLPRAGPGYRQLTLEPWFSHRLWGENRDRAEQLQPWNGTSQGLGSAGISYSTLWVSYWPWTHNIEIMEILVSLFVMCDL